MGDRTILGPASCDDHRLHTIGCLDCAAAVCAAEDDDLGDFLARMEHIGWPAVDEQNGSSSPSSSVSLEGEQLQ